MTVMNHAFYHSPPCYHSPPWLCLCHHLCRQNDQNDQGYQNTTQDKIPRLVTSNIIKKTPLVCAMSFIGCAMMPMFTHASVHEAAVHMSAHEQPSEPKTPNIKSMPTVEQSHAHAHRQSQQIQQNQSIDLAQHALKRLSQYYVSYHDVPSYPTPANDLNNDPNDLSNNPNNPNNPNDAVTSFYSSPNHSPNQTNITDKQTDNKQTDSKQTDNKIDNTANQLSNRIHDWIGADAPLCAGRWVYPSSITNNDNGLNQQTNHVATPSSPTNTLKAQADHGYYDNVRHATLTGNVLIQQNNQVIQADKVLVDVQSQHATASGNVLFADRPTSQLSAMTSTTQATAGNHGNADQPLHAHQQLSRGLTQGGLITIAEEVQYNSQSQLAHANDVAFASIPLQAHGHAKTLRKTGNDRLHLTDVMFTTCPPTNPKWRLQAGSIELNNQSGRGVAKDARLKIGDVPVAYLPYFNFPIDDRRASGFLLPSVSWRNDGQVELQTPYYANLAANMDTTITPRVFSNRNPMLSAEFRHLSHDFGHSQIQGDYLPNDRQYDKKTRKSLFAKHLWQSKHVDNLTGEAVYQYVSDADFIDDFEVFGTTGREHLGNFDNHAHLPRSARLNYFNEYINAHLKVETYQNLDVIDAFGNPTTDALKPYSKLPQLTVNYALPLNQWLKNNNHINNITNSITNNIKLTGVHDSGYFQKSITDNSAPEKSGFRMYNKLTAIYPMHNAWGYAVPSVSLQQLFARYDEHTTLNNQISKQDRQQGIFLPSVALDTGIYLKKIGSPFGWFDGVDDHNKAIIKNGHQLLSPRLKYTYTPFKDQNSLPNFNTRIASLSYEQLFADSWFLGHDRIQDLHAITPAINYRYIDSEGNTRLDVGIAEQFYLSHGKTRLSDFISTPNTHASSDKALFSNRSSGMVASIQAQPIKQLWWHVNIASKSDRRLNFLTSQLRYQPTDNSMISLGVINRQADQNTNQLPLKAYTASLVMPVNQNWRLMAQGQFDDERYQITDGLLGIDFQDCCIGASVYVRRHTNELDITARPDNTIMAELRLTGLSPKSGRFSRLLQDRTYGLTPVQDAWVK